MLVYEANFLAVVPDGVLPKDVRMTQVSVDHHLAQKALRQRVVWDLSDTVRLLQLNVNRPIGTQGTMRLTACVHFTNVSQNQLGCHKALFRVFAVILGRM
jgi:hypothetical protein